ncbi:molybdopterin synthase subunit MoaE /molybdopterin guanine dinucleotide biosynthesis accessory protein MobB [Haladaptatus litoreus]|uniref:Molybdopterin synthase subunit MoaE /molybdopterin guanine dinucleotide biosynthesis accessory protein MobB n=1 Tax=Haladaptatus litoreus TaxID=553468 RepID=A0A1N7B998_9EURY|nr:molybdopterin synthase [Haladaptatus litoreus]SIR47945.1 molybdopterin synthase subunit MoaE /molybdopterin guanine dinucleotide biosynthesis accessory protein MobB [Haladaptatus litoreus]
MKVLGVVGRESAAVADRLASRLAEQGRVGVITSEGSNPAVTGDAVESTASLDSSVTTTFELGDDGWSASGTNRSLSGVLDELAPTHDYAIVAGFPNVDAPTVLLGDADGVGEPLIRAENADSLEIEAVRDAVGGVEEYETLESLVARAKKSPNAERSGAIATFTGRVRAKDSDDDTPTESLEFEMYDGVAQTKLNTIREELEARDGVFTVLLHHRTGVIEYGEDIVFVVVLAGHREEAFRTVEDGINRLKAEVPIFKKEVTTDEQFWVHEQ